MNAINNRITYQTCPGHAQRGLRPPAGCCPFPIWTRHSSRRNRQPHHRRRRISLPTACCWALPSCSPAWSPSSGTLVFMLSHQRAGSRWWWCCSRPCPCLMARFIATPHLLRCSGCSPRPAGEQTALHRRDDRRAEGGAGLRPRRRRAWRSLTRSTSSCAECSLQGHVLLLPDQPAATRFVNSVIYAGGGAGGRCLHLTAAGGAAPSGSSPAS